ncbi:hypothetical protein L6164_013472 [Bauhinia variegata]|uniref:Uncharacterized protein n=1 Tax=Bauhinia variegata TaxID=167791 RepID=A0ACB9NJ64_BAUVA|nr:hypothetical protein L6164_013472 [Bauhinia variegata]
MQYVILDVDNKYKGDGHGIDWFYVSMTFGFIVGFWGFIGPLFLYRSWKRTYFQLIDNMCHKVKLRSEWHQPHLEFPRQIHHKRILSVAEPSQVGDQGASLAGNKDIGSVHVMVKELLDQPGDSKSFQYVSYQVRKPLEKPKSSTNLSGDKISAPDLAPPSTPTMATVPKGKDKPVE